MVEAFGRFCCSGVNVGPGRHFDRSRGRVQSTSAESCPPRPALEGRDLPHRARDRARQEQAASKGWQAHITRIPADFDPSVVMESRGTGRILRRSGFACPGIKPGAGDRKSRAGYALARRPCSTVRPRARTRARRNRVRRKARCGQAQRLSQSAAKSQRGPFLEAPL